MRRFPGIAAALVPCLASCGETRSPFSDASVSDAATVDAEVPAGDITVTTHSRCCDAPQGTLVADVPVFAVEPDGTLAASGETDSSGTVTLSGVRAGSSVTAVYTRDDGGFDIVTTVGVQPGDELVFGERYIGNYPSGVDGTLSATWPAVAGASYFYVHTPCSSHYFDGATTAGTLQAYYYCQAPNASILFTAYDASGNLAQNGLVAGINFVPGQAVNLGAWSAPTSFAIDVDQIPSVVEEIQMGAYQTLPPYNTWGDNYYENPENGSASATFPIPSVGGGIYAYTYLYRPGEFGGQEQSVSRPANATSVSFSHDELPWLGDTLFSPSARVASWIQVGDRAYDGAVAFIDWNRFDGGEGTALGGGSGDYDWTVFLPPGVTTWTWPEPPAALAPYMPGLEDNVDFDVMLVDLGDADGYDGLRAAPEWLASCPSCVAYEGELETAATVSYSGDGGEGFSDRRPQPTVRARR